MTMTLCCCSKEWATGCACAACASGRMKGTVRSTVDAGWYRRSRLMVEMGDAKSRGESARMRRGMGWDELR